MLEFRTKMNACVPSVVGCVYIGSISQSQFANQLVIVLSSNYQNCVPVLISRVHIIPKFQSLSQRPESPMPSQREKIQCLQLLEFILIISLSFRVAL